MNILFTPSGPKGVDKVLHLPASFTRVDVRAIKLPGGWEDNFSLHSWKHVWA